MELVVDTLGRLETLRAFPARRHELCVGTVAAEVCRIVGLENGRADMIGRAATLHDIGKVVLPDAVLGKAGSLSFVETETVKMHAKLGYEMLRGSGRPEMELAAQFALWHHERADGTGYPDGLRLRDIPFEVRLVTMADIYSALREQRSYKPPMPHEYALHVIAHGDERVRPSFFDPEILRAVVASGKALDGAFNSQLALN